MNRNRSGEFDLTTTQRRLYELLEDGQPHSKAECLLHATGKRFSSPRLLAVHVARMRPSLARRGHRILPIEAFGYRLIKPEKRDA